MFSTPNAQAVRWWVPMRLMATDASEPATFSKRSAGPPDFIVRSVISVISRSESTIAVMRFRSPRSSKNSMNCRISLKCMALGVPRSQSDFSR